MSEEFNKPETKKSEKPEPPLEAKSEGLSNSILALLESAHKAAGHSTSNTDKANAGPESLEFSSKNLYLTAAKVGAAGLRILSDAHDRYEHNDGKVRPHNPNEVVEEKTLDWRGQSLQLRTRDGVPEYYKDQDGNEWTSKDANGWSKKGGLISETFQAQIKFDESKKELSLETPYGNRTVFASDGSALTSFKTREGKEVSQRSSPDGRQIVQDGNKTWESLDGKNWTSPAGKKEGDYKIDENGRLLFTDSKEQEKVEKQSDTTQSIYERMEQLEQKFNITIGRPGDKPIYTEDKNKLSFDVRLPTMDELKVTEDVLAKFAHVAKKNGSNFERLQIHFAAAKGNALNFDEHGWHDESRDGKPPLIGIAPRDFAQTRGYDGMEGTLLHEMTHQLQELEWIDSRHKEKVPPEIEKFFGFQKVMPPRTKDEDGTYRLTDSQGKQWQYENQKGSVNDEAEWFPVEKDKVIHDESRALSDKQMRQKLPPEQRPATDYFFNPAETHAEAISMYLYDRKMLHDTNKALYEAVKKWDQKDINYRYGFKTREDGQIVSKMIRSAEGKVVPNTGENRRSVREMEDSWPKMPEAKQTPVPVSGHRCSRC